MATTVSIQLKTEVPGPQSRAILDRKERVIAEPLGIYLPLVIAEGHGAVLTDVDGNSFLDFTGGIGCLAVGHSHPKVVEAAQEQAALFTHTDFTIVPYENYVSLAERLAAITPISGEVRAGFFNSGAEAVENAVKIAKKYTKRPAVIAFDGAFHGRTLMAMSLTSKPHPYKAGFGPFAPEVYRVSFSDSYRGPDTATALAELRRAFKTRVAAEEVAAIIFEPVQGESGFVTAPKDFVQGVREIASEHGIVLIVDEVQTGFGRTGTMFAIEQYDIEPDLMTVAKSIAAGLPLSGVIGRSEIMDAPEDSTIGGTYVGNPVSIAAAHAVLDVIEEEQLVERAAEIGDRTRARMHEWQEKFSCIGDVRGLGMMLAIEIVSDRDAKTPDAALATAIQEAAAARGVLLLKAGLYGNCIRVLCPLVITDEQLEEALGAWEAAIEAVTAA
jgi:4-aminobutyrate aminotransferase / (S)-3-amino-2-methylpropionate transaminase / 5-aminovalerate transaminase